MALQRDYNDGVFYDYYTDESNTEIFSETTSTLHIISSVCYILFFCISIAGNSFVLRVLLRERAWKTPSDILLLQLTMSNLCFTVIMPFMAYYVRHGWIFGDWACRVIIGAYFLGLDSYALILTAMTLYHYVVVVHASCLSAQARTKCCVIIASIMIWLVCAAVSIKASVNSGIRNHEFGDTMCVHDPQSFTMELFDICMQIGLFFLIPFIIMTLCCVHMLITIKQCRMQINHQSSILISGMIVVFFLCLVPINITNFISSLFMFGVLENFPEWTWDTHRIWAITCILLSLHCCLNPLFHIFGAQRMKRHLPMPCKASSQRRNGCQNLSSMAVISERDASV